VGLERGPLSLVSANEELLGRNSSSGSGLESREYGHGDPLALTTRHPLSPKVGTSFADKWRLPHFLDNRLTEGDGDEVLSLTYRQPFAIQEDSFLLQAESTPRPQRGGKENMEASTSHYLKGLNGLLH
jgi:hypothetical protein